MRLLKVILLLNLLIIHPEAGATDNTVVDVICGKKPFSYDLRRMKHLETDLICFISHVAFEGKVNFIHAPDNEYDAVIVQYSTILIFPEDFFLHFKSVSRLDIKDCSMLTITSNVFENATNLLQLRMNNDQLERINLKQFTGAKNLELLELEINNIQQIDSGAFEGLEKLEGLSLKNNKLTSLPENIFDPLKALKWINMENNKLTFLHPMIFVKCHSLEHLYMEKNGLIIANLYFSSKMMQHLDFTLNKLQELAIRVTTNSSLSSHSELTILAEDMQIKSFWIDPQLQVTQLRMSGNKLTDISNITNFLTSLSILDFSNNPIGTLAPQAFSNLISLTELHLTNCKIKFTGSPFDGLNNLIRLLLDSNNLQSFNLKWLEKLENLNEVDFTRNNLTKLELHNNTFNKNEPLVLFLGENKFECEYLREIIDLLKGKVHFLTRSYEHPRLNIDGIECVVQKETSTLTQQSNLEVKEEFSKLIETIEEVQNHIEDLTNYVLKENNQQDIQMIHQNMSVLKILIIIVLCLCICIISYLAFSHLKISPKPKVNYMHFSELQSNQDAEPAVMIN